MAEVISESVDPIDVLRGRNVMVVEDNGLLCCVLEETLREAGCEIVGPFARLTDALDAVPTSRIDVAVLDINLRGELVSPLANCLTDRGVPFVVTSAYHTRDLPSELQTADQLRKPYTGSDVLEHLAFVLCRKNRNN